MEKGQACTTLDMVIVDENNPEIPLAVEIEDNELYEIEGDSSLGEEGPTDFEGYEDIGEGYDIKGSLIGLKRKTWTEIHDLYKRHSRVNGFSVRKSTTRRLPTPTTNEPEIIPPCSPIMETQTPTSPNLEFVSPTMTEAPTKFQEKEKNMHPAVKKVLGRVCEKYFVCSCEGSMNTGTKLDPLIEEDSPNIVPKKRKQRSVPVTRTGCHAGLRAKLNKDGLFEVVKHVVAHNHKLTPVEWQHHHRSERAIEPAEGEFIQTMTEARVPPSIQYRYLSTRSGGEQFVGHTKKDHYNYVHRYKKKKLSLGDAQTLHDTLKKRAAEDPSFFYAIKYDDKGRLRNIFWRDAMMKEDYLLYHDVLVFDTTYQTNKYRLIAGVFVGINNHWSNVMFGCALISDETTESFEWLFNTFKESMEVGINPYSIFTDQDQAMSNAINKVWPMSRHRLCQWHILQNAMSHFGTLKHDDTFQDAFNKCLSGCYTETEFESTWDDLEANYDIIVDDEWFNRLYDLRHKWSTAFSKHIFSAGILSSQRSESTNNSIGFPTKKTTSLNDFYVILNEALQRWRSEEQKNEFQCIRATPLLDKPIIGLLKSAANFYTLKMFKRFQEEFNNCLGTKTILVSTDELGTTYKVYPEDSPNYVHFVTVDLASPFISCTCKHWEEAKLFCFHSLRVLHMNSVSTIPELYMTESKRWSKFAKTEVWERFRENTVQINMDNEINNWRIEMTNTCQTLIQNCQDTPIKRAFFKQACASLFDGLQSVNETGNPTSVVEPSGTVLDPARCVTKGRRGRLKRGTNSSRPKNQGSRTKANVNSQKFTPIPRLI